VNLINKLNIYLVELQIKTKQLLYLIKKSNDKSVGFKKEIFMCMSRHVLPKIKNT